MAIIKKNMPPTYDHSREYDENFSEFFDWAGGLRNPAKSIKALAEQHNFTTREHSLGFTVVYLSERHPELASRQSGIARAHIYPNDRLIHDDIHSHGFAFSGGVVTGDFTQTLHFPDFTTRTDEGEGYIGYETQVDLAGNTRVIQATDAVISVPRSESSELGRGDLYALGGKHQFHSVGGQGVVTLFCKTPSAYGSEGDSLILRKPEKHAPRDY